MGAITFVARAQLRRRRGAAVVLAVVVALVGGAAIALAAGASRARTVVDRYFAPATTYDVSATAPGVTIDQVRAMPGVRQVDRRAYVGAVADRTDGTPYVLNLQAVEQQPWDAMIRVRQGRLPRPDALTEVAVNQQVLDDFGVRVGDDFPVRMFREDDFDTVASGALQASGDTVVLRVVGLIDAPDQMEADVVSGGSQAANLTTAIVPFGFYGTFGPDFGVQYDVDLESPASLGAFEQAFAAAAQATSPPSEAQFTSAGYAGRKPTLAAPARVQATVLAALALVLAVAGAVVVALLVAADERVVAHERLALSAAGMTRSQRALLPVRRSLAAAALGAVLAGGVAVAVSGRFPVGSSRLLERDPGTQVNLAVVLGGMTLAAAVTLAMAFGAGRLATRPRRGAPERPATAARLLAQANAPVEATVGGHLAFPGRMASARVPSWQTVGAGVVAVTAVVAVGLYADGTTYLRDVRAAHGFAWDMLLGNTNFSMPDDAAARLRSDPRFASVTDVQSGTATLDGDTVEVVALASSGRDSIEVVRGRAPRTPGEIALGSHLLARLGRSVGDTVRFSLAGSELAQPDVPTTDRDLTIVGEAVAPALNGGADFADSAVVSIDALAQAGAALTPHLLAVRLAPGTDRAAVATDLRRTYPLWVTTDIVPAKVEGLWRSRVLLVGGALVTAALGALLLAYTLATTTRLRQRDLAVLRALGLRPVGARRAVVWQGLLVAAVVLAIGAPLGVVIGTVVWRKVAEQIGVSPQLHASPSLLLVIPATMLLAVLASAVPAGHARRLRVAEALRVE